MLLLCNYYYVIHVYIIIIIIFIIIDFQNIIGTVSSKIGIVGLYITIKIARYTNPHIFATILPFPFIFRTHVPTSFLYFNFYFGALIFFYVVSAKIANPTG